MIKGGFVIFEGIKHDIRAIKDRDPAARNSAEVLLLYSGLHALMLHRPAHWLYQKRCYFSARLISQVAKFLTGIEIHPGAKMGRGILIDHGSGVVIGETAEVGDDCTIYQGATLGGTGKDKGKRHPTVGKGVMIGSGAKILGPVTVGDHSKVASNAVLLTSIEAHTTAVGVPPKAVRIQGEKIPSGREEESADLNHADIPDPVAMELARLQEAVDALAARLALLEKR